MNFVPIGLLTPSPRRPTQFKCPAKPILTLPPLPPTLNEVANVSNKDGTHIETSYITPLHAENSHHIVSWPQPSDSYTKHGLLDSTGDLELNSPISPKVQKLYNRTRLIDDTRPRPTLLQELSKFLDTELQTENGQTSHRPTLQRLQVVREVFNRLIENFSVYAPVLTRIRDEYENAVEYLHAQSLKVPGMQTRLQSVETHYLQQLSTSNAEAKVLSVSLKRRLTETQALLAASAAENARLHSELKREQDNLAKAECKLVGLQRSTSVLVNSVRRHEENLRMDQEQSFEDSKAFEKLTTRYSHVCDEVAELRRTVATFEEQRNREQVAADKKTIGLLSTELQELSETLKTAIESSKAPKSSHTDDISKQALLNAAFIKGMKGFGLEMELPHLLNEMSIESGSVDDVAALITFKLRQVQQQHYALLNTRTEAGGLLNDPMVFLTEPPELLTLSEVMAQQFVGRDFIACRELGINIPTFLQYDGIVRNLYYSRAKIEQMIEQVWNQYDEQARFIDSGQSTSAIANFPLSSETSLLTVALDRFLQRARDHRADQVELAYNFLSGVERFRTRSSVCRLFHLVYCQELSVEARSDQSRELAALHDALVTVDQDRHSSTILADSSSVTCPPPGQVSLADLVQALRQTFPWKSDAALSQLHRATIVDLRGQLHVDYTTLIAQESFLNQIKPEFGLRQLAESLKMQRLDDLLTFQHHVHDQIRRGGSQSTELVSEDCRTQLISLHDFRVCLQAADSAMPESEITQILVKVSGLNAQALFTHDNMMLDKNQVLKRLKMLLLRPSGKL
ncbi:putative translin-associated factor X-interacting protein [Plasmopara halstedii]